MKKTLLSTLALLFVAGTASAQVQADATANVSLTVVPGISITSSGAVTFGNIAPGQGMVAIDEAGTLSSSLLGIGTGAGTVATFTVQGHPGAQFQVLAQAATLQREGGGANLTFTPTLYVNGSELSGNQTLSAAVADGLGELDIVVGGSVTVGATQQTGTYSGDVELVVNYTST